MMMITQRLTTSALVTLAAFCPSCMSGSTEGGSKVPSSEDAPKPPAAPVWAGEGARVVIIEDKRYWSAVGVATDTDAEVARTKATNSAKQELAKTKSTTVKSDSTTVTSTTISETASATAIEVRSNDKVTSAAELEGVVEVDHVSTPIDSRYVRAYVRVVVPENNLFPSKRILGLLETGGTPEDFIALGNTYEMEGQRLLAEKAFSYVARTSDSAKDYLRLARFYSRTNDVRLALEMARSAKLRGSGPDDRSTRDQADELIRSLSADLPTVSQCAAMLTELAEQRAGSALTGDLSPGANTDYTFAVRLEGRLGYRFLLSWVESDELRAHWVLDQHFEDGDQRPYVDFDLPSGVPQVRVICWALPSSSPVWRRAGQLRNKDFIKDKATKGDRLQLRDFLYAIRSEAAALAVVGTVKQR